MSAPVREQTRARQPDQSGFVERAGVRSFYEIYGSGGPTVFLLPTWSIIHSRHWKLQIPYLARHFRVLTFDARGNGRSDRPATGYSEREIAEDALAVMDATETSRAILVSLSLGACWALMLAADHASRVDGLVFVGPAVPLGEPPKGQPPADQVAFLWNAELGVDEGWAKYNRHYWLRDYRGFLDFFFAQLFPEPHSTKQIEDCVGYALETTPEIVVATQAEQVLDEEAARELCSRVRCPTLVIQGTDDRITGPDRGRALAAALRGELVEMPGSGHAPHAREPIQVNRLLHRFVTHNATP